MRNARLLCLASAMALISCRPAAAQADPHKYAPARPKLPASADTNSAGVYYNLGLSLLERNNAVNAAAAFHWATRLNPAWAEPLYAKRIALHLMSPNRLGDYLSGRPGFLRSREVRAIDSFGYAARLRNPLLRTGLDLRLFQGWYYEATGLTLNHMELRELGPVATAWLAMSTGDYPRAVELYGRVVKDKRAWSFRYDLAMALYYTGQHDSAVAELQRYIEGARTDEKKEKDVVVFYEPKAMAEYTIGHIYFVMDRRDDARAAFGRALSEDLSFYAAHLYLGELARAARDSATALQELQLAAELAPDDAMVHYRFGRALHDAKRHDDAIRELDQSAQLEPAYADPWYYLGLAQEASGRKDEAIRAFEGYLARASREVRQERAQAEARIAALKRAT